MLERDLGVEILDGVGGRLGEGVGFGSHVSCP
jgi:hypothetical protein